VAELPYAVILVLATLSGLTTLIGVVLALTLGRSERGAVVGIGFSTGIMLVISFAELIPEAAATAGWWNALGATLLGLSLLATVDPLIAHVHIVEEGGVYGEELKSAYLVAFGLILHDFPEGFAMANAYVHSPALGVLITLAIGLHNVPEEFAMCLPVVPALNPLFMAFAAGAMIYVSGHELYPMAQRYGNMCLFGLGLVLGVLAFGGLRLLTPVVTG